VDNNLTSAQVLQQAKDFLTGLSLKQRALLIGGALLVAATLYVFVELIGKPEYKTLYSGLAPSDAQDIAASLTAKQIPFQQSPDGASILVPADKLDSARLEVASQPMPRSGRLGFELFDKPNWAGSDFSEKVNYQRALEAELERSLATLSEVAAVRVHLVMPEDSLYSERDRTAKASVMVKLRRGSLPQQEDMAIRQLVAGAVDRLSPENVVVVDADTNMPLNRFGGSAGEAGATEIDQQLAKRVVETLEPVVGTDGVRASVHVEFDLSSDEETQETYDPAGSVPLSVTRSEETMGGGAPAGVPGTSSNLPNAKVTPPAKSAAQTQSSKSESSTYGVSKLVRHTVQPAGRIKRIAAALLVDDAVDVQQKGSQRVASRRKRTADEMKQIEGLAAAALGIDGKRGDLLAVENLSFQSLQQDAPLAPTMMEKVQHTLHEWTWLLRYVALGCLFGGVYLLLLRPVKKQVLTSLRALPPRAATAALPAGGEASAEKGGARKPDSLEEILGISSEEDAATMKKLSALKSQLVEKVKTQPGGASRLVQNWLKEGGVE
jgi:flagellar M-ring protein FliF